MKVESIDQLIAMLPDAILSSHNGPSDVYSPFEITAQDYLGFAIEDIAGGQEPHDLINAVGNIKRALDCRIDSILHYWGLYKLAKKKNLSFEQKLSMISSFGIIAPSVLQKINTFRNKSEHDYTKPGAESVQDFCDIAQLFIGYTDSFIRTEVEADVEEVDEQYGNWYRISFDREKAQFVFKIFYSVIDQTTQKRSVNESELVVTIGEDIEDFVKAIGWWYELLGR